MATLQQCIDQIQDAVRVISNIRAAPDKPPETINVFPYAVAYAESGSYRLEPGGYAGQHTIVLELHVGRRNLASDVQQAMSYAKSIPNAIFAAHRAGTLSAMDMMGPITYEFGELGSTDVLTIGFRFRITDVGTTDTIT